MKILACDDHAVFRAGLRAALHDLDAEVLEAESCEEALEVVAREGDVDLVLLDLGLPGMDGLAGLRMLRANHPEIAVVIISASEDVDKVRLALAEGASGFIPKSSSTSVLQSALRIVMSGSIYIPPAILPALEGELPPQDTVAEAHGRSSETATLTRRQLEVLRLIARGLTNKEIAGVLEIGAGTVKTHASAIFEALGVTNRTEAVMAMRNLGLDETDDTEQG